MRVTLYAPEPGPGLPGTVWAMLQLTDCRVPRQQVNGWTRLELLIAYDWAVREHLHASDNTRVQRRERPSFLAEIAWPCITGCEQLSRQGWMVRP